MSNILIHEIIAWCTDGDCCENWLSTNIDDVMEKGFRCYCSWRSELERFGDIDDEYDFAETEETFKERLNNKIGDNEYCHVFIQAHDFHVEFVHKVHELELKFL